MDQVEPAATVTVGAGFVRLTFFPYGPGQTRREPLIIRNRTQAYYLAVQLCEAIHRAWPGADRMDPSALP